MFRLEELEVYSLSQDFSDRIWAVVETWEAFPKFGLGRQLTSAADSISANIAEGYGRFFFKENLQFCFYSRGSLLEAKCWLTKAQSRHLVKKIDYDVLINDLEIIHKKLNAYINVLRANAN